MIQPPPQVLAPAQETSTDEQYLQHEFITWSGWNEWMSGWTAAEARNAVEMHLKGWPYLASSLARHLPRFAFILGALIQRTAPPLRTTWRQASERGPRYAVRDLDDVWKKQWRPNYETKLRDMAILGGSVLHVHWKPDVAAGVERPILKRWPHEAMYWRPAAPDSPGGWYAITNDSGLVRMTPGDGHWIFLAHGERWHELAAILSLGEAFVGGKLAERDEAGLSEAAGRAGPVAELPVGPNNTLITANDEIGKTVQDMIKGMGRARVGAVVPNGTKVLPFNIVSDTAFFDRYGMRQLLKVALSILGQSATLSPGANGVYQPIVSWSVADALSDKDHEATTRAWNEGVARHYLALNGITSDVHLVGERYVDAGARAKAEAERATLLASTIKAMRDAGLAPTQADVDLLAGKLSTGKITIMTNKEPTGPTGALVTVGEKPVAGSGATDTPAQAAKTEAENAPPTSP